MPAPARPRGRANSRFVQQHQPLHPIRAARLGAKLPFVVDMTSTSEKEPVMNTQSNVCGCKTCVGTQCTCGCHNSAPAQSASCQCGDVCNCGPTCTCEGCQHANVRKVESR